MKGFDKGVDDEHLFSPKLWPNSTATGESEILYFPLPSKSLAYKPFEYIHIESWRFIYNTTFKFKDCSVEKNKIFYCEFRMAFDSETSIYQRIFIIQLVSPDEVWTDTLEF